MSDGKPTSGSSTSRTTARRCAGRSTTSGFPHGAARRCPGRTSRSPSRSPAARASTCRCCEIGRPHDRRLDRDPRRAGGALPGPAPLPRRPRAAPPRARAGGLLRRGAGARTRACFAFHELSQRAGDVRRGRGGGGAGPARQGQGPGRRSTPAAYTGLRFGVKSDAGGGGTARDEDRRALDRLEAELAANGGGEFLVGDELQRRRPDRGLALLPRGRPG